MIAQNAIVIHQLRVRANDPVVTPLRVMHALSQITLSPRQLAPFSVLCVRKLRDPLPDQLPASAGLLRPPARCPRWRK